MTPEEVTYLAVLLCSIPIGFVFKDCGPWGRQLGGAAVGAGLALATCGPHVLHSLLTVLGTWVLLRLLPRRCGAAALGWTFGYLLFFRTPGVWGLPEPPPYANALQLLLTLKMVSVASDVQELREAEQHRAWTEETDLLIGSLQRCPGLVELLCYAYCYLGLLTGPFYRYGTHRDWVRGRGGGPSWRRVLGRLRWVPALGVLGEAAARLGALEGVQDPRFGAQPLLWRLAHMVPVFFAFRMRFYVGWLCAEAACLAAALGGYPPAARARPGQGPTCRWHPAEAPPAVEWDYETIRTIDPLGTECCRRFREGLRRWNMTVQWWLAHYVHRRAPCLPPTLRSGWTMLVSAYWHGLQPGYYLSFLSVPLCMAAERAAERALGAGSEPRQGAGAEQRPRGEEPGLRKAGAEPRGAEAGLQEAEPVLRGAGEESRNLTVRQGVEAEWRGAEPREAELRVRGAGGEARKAEPQLLTGQQRVGAEPQGEEPWAWQRAWRGAWRGWVPALGAVTQWFLKMRAYDYLCMGFVLRQAGPTLRYWGSIYYCGHLLPLLILLLAALAPARGGGAPAGGGSGQPRPRPKGRGREDPLL